MAHNYTRVESSRLMENDSTSDDAAREDPVGHREEEPKTNDKLRAVAKQWVFGRKFESERSLHDPMDCNQGPQGPDRGSPENWAWPAEAKPEAQPSLGDMNSKGKVDRDWSSNGGKGPNTQANPPAREETTDTQPGQSGQGSGAGAGK